jgi:hypothetical protein
VFVFLHTEPFRRWLAGQPLLENLLLTLSGIGVGEWVLL